MQKIPYFSEPPNVHPSSIPAMISFETSTKSVSCRHGLFLLIYIIWNRYGLEGNVAPGAENVGQAQIVTEFAPAFDLGGLFGQADEGAFKDADMQDEEEHVDIVQE